jgi:hypothetical protein
VIDSVTKLSTALLYVQRKVERGWRRGRLGVVSHRFGKTVILTIFQRFRKIIFDFRVFIYYNLFALGTGVAHGNVYE